MGGNGMMHQQPYMAQPGYNTYQGYAPDRFNSAGMYQQSPWINGEPMLGTGSPIGMSNQVMGPKLLLEPPVMLGRLDTKAMVSALKGGAWPGRRGQTFRSTGTATQFGKEWCDVVRQACSAAEQQAEGENWQLSQAVASAS